jgi:PAS domain-containing protein
MISGHTAGESAARRGPVDAIATLDAVSEPMLCIDLNNKITYLNQAAEEMTGWRLTEAQGLPAEQVFRLITGDTGESATDGIRIFVPRCQTRPGRSRQCISYSG